MSSQSIRATWEQWDELSAWIDKLEWEERITRSEVPDVVWFIQRQTRERRELFG